MALPEPATVAPLPERLVEYLALRDRHPRWFRNSPGGVEILLDPGAILEVEREIGARYAGYLERQERDIAAFRRDEALLLPPNLDYGAVGGLSREVRDKLAAARPATLGAASRLSGVTPAALVALLGHVKRRAA